MPNEKQRCAWVKSDPLMREYHDKEWGRPVHDSRLLWEMLMLEGFQAGLSWLVILRKREAFRRAFLNFDPVKVARFGEPEIALLLADEGIVRSRAKIEATIAGARIYNGMGQSGEDFSKWVWSLAGGNPIVNRADTVPAETELSRKISAELKNRGFKFVGPVIVYAWMQAVGITDDHSADCYRSKARR